MSQPSTTAPHVPLTARYRPQCFADVAGQETVTAILSRAALEDRVAPAYLFSGTRGVGKTTIARIFAKALNCRNAPCAEPCNECDQCRRITQGGCVDVIEIDGASNRGIDDARRLKESIGYAPLDARYKVFIIDEAHMLTREAFNALLKTLEEPPARVTFILATTELHKLPATILSRCQQFTFKRLTEQRLAEHLTAILTKEHIEFEPTALRLIAKRGAGSVRDSMSLLGQVLALGEGRLTEAASRDILGLAGQELFAGCLNAIARQDAPAVAAIVTSLLDQGVDIGFFLRELGALWRNLFMLRQAGDAALGVLDISAEEIAVLKDIAGQFELAHIHACWQMTLEGQRRILTSLEPSQGLELLLLNLAMLPRLISMEQLSRGAPVAGGPAGSSGSPVTGALAAQSGGAPAAPAFTAGASTASPATAAGVPAFSAQPKAAPQVTSPRATPPQSAPPAGTTDANRPPWETPAEQASATVNTPAAKALLSPPASAKSAESPAQVAHEETIPEAASMQDDTNAAPDTLSHNSAKAAGAPDADVTFADTADANTPEASPQTAPATPRAVPAMPPANSTQPAPPAQPSSSTPPASWEEFLEYCAVTPDAGTVPSVLRQVRGILENGQLRIIPRFAMQKAQLELAQNMSILTRLARQAFGPSCNLLLDEPELPPKSPVELRAEAEEHPAVAALKNELGATLVSCRQTGLL